MNWDRVEGKWKQLRGSARTKWGKLTDDDLDQVAGKKDKLVGLIQERYGIAKDEADKQTDDWLRSLRDNSQGFRAAKS
jgi:uncharacterized protein YjbJ (UPF0337 family)